MPIPTSNGLDVTYFGRARFGELKSMVDGSKWGGPLGTGVEVTFSFPGETSWWSTNYSSDDEPDSYSAFVNRHKQDARTALDAWAAVSSISFREVSDNSVEVGEIRFAFFNDMPKNTYAWAYLPLEDASAGDVWFNDNMFDWDNGAGSEFLLTALHELGHSIGLDHSFDLPKKHDNFFYTVMSYTASPWTNDEYASFYPTTPMFFDIQLTQEIYGIDTNTNAGNTRYKFDGGTYFETIYDAGGFDTIVYSGSLSAIIALTIGSFNRLSAPIEFSDGITSRDTVAIGPNTIIEKAVGGQMGDKLLGNSADNVLVGRGGNDVIKGFGGSDKIVGGQDADVMVGGGGDDRFVFRKTGDIGQNAGDRDLIKGFRSGQDQIDLRGIDAKTGIGGNNAFAFFAAKSDDFGGSKGELRWYQQNRPGTANDKTFLIGDVDGDRAADFALEFKGLVNLSAGDILV